MVKIAAVHGVDRIMPSVIAAGIANSSFDSNTYNNDFNFSDSSYSSSGGFAENDDSFGSFQGTGSGKPFEDITDGSFNGGVGFADDDFSSKN